MDKIKDKKFAKKFISDVTDKLANSFDGLNYEQLTSIIETARELSQTNCGYQSYWMKDIIIQIADDRRLNIKLQEKINQQTSNKINNQ